MFCYINILYLHSSSLNPIFIFPKNFGHFLQSEKNIFVLGNYRTQFSARPPNKNKESTLEVCSVSQLVPRLSFPLENPYLTSRYTKSIRVAQTILHLESYESVSSRRSHSFLVSTGVPQPDAEEIFNTSLPYAWHLLESVTSSLRKEVIYIHVFYFNCPYQGGSSRLYKGRHASRPAHSSTTILPTSKGIVSHGRTAGASK